MGLETDSSLVRDGLNRLSVGFESSDRVWWCELDEDALERIEGDFLARLLLVVLDAISLTVLLLL